MAPSVHAGRGRRGVGVRTARGRFPSGGETRGGGVILAIMFSRGHFQGSLLLSISSRVR